MKQVLVNNGFPNYIVDREIKVVLSNISLGKQQDNTSKIKILYCNQMNDNYKVDETVISNIIKSNVIPKKTTSKIDLIIYYKNRKAHQMVMKNNLTRKKCPLSKTSVIYHFTCPHDVCKHQSEVNNAYTGYTRMTVSRRLSYHKSNGAIAQHSLQIHGRQVTRVELVNNTEIRYIIPDRRRLETLESLLMKYEVPEINKQDTEIKRTLHLYD